ncbi:MAG: cytochrome c [Oligoflexales bacterium]|nr:cytochrome c [Oligoflexales bacterium]
MKTSIYLSILSSLILWIVIAFSSNQALSADRKAIKAEQSAKLRGFLELIFSLEQLDGLQASEARNRLQRVKEKYSQISKTLSPKAQTKLEEGFVKVLAKHGTENSQKQAIYDLKQEVIDAFEIDTAPPLSPNLNLARVQYQEYCSSCHGNKGHGDGILSKRLPKKPKDFTTQDFSSKNSPLRTLNMLLVGNKKEGMPVFEHQLSNQELWSLSYYIQTIPYEEKYPSIDLESTLIKKGLSYSLLARLNDDELWEWVGNNLKDTDAPLKKDRVGLIASIRQHYSFSKKVPRR